MMTRFIPVNRYGSITSERRWKFLLIAPLVVFPLLTLLGWSSGAVVLHPSQSARFSNHGKLNSRLPAAVLAPDRNWNKLTYYLKADRDSAKQREAQKRDPYFGLRIPAPAAFRHRRLEDSLNVQPAAGPSIRRSAGLGPMPTGLVHERHPSLLSETQPAADQQRREIYRKLALLQKVLDQQAIHRPAGAFTGPATRGNSSISQNPLPAPRRTGPIPASLNGEKAGGDPEMAQLSAIMDKILAVQHPEMLTDSLRRAAKERLGHRYRVTGGQPDLITRIDSRGRRGPAYQVPAAEPFTSKPRATPQNRFYSVEVEASHHQTAATFKAMVPETQTLTSGARIKLELSEDLYVEGIRVPRGTLLYGTSLITSQRVRVNISSLAVSGNLIPVALSVYDLDGLEGIHIPGAGTRKALKTSGASAVQSIGIGSLDPAVGAQAAAAGIRAARSLLAGKIKRVRVTVKAGYQLLLKDRRDAE